MSESTVSRLLPGSEVVPTLGERFVGVLRRPRSTFAGLTDADAWFWPAILLLIGYTLYYLAYGVGGARLQTSWMMSAIPTTGPNANTAAARNMATYMAWLAPASQLLGNIVQVPMTVALSWAVRSALFYGLARLLGGAKPHWGRVVAMVGWAWVPLFFQFTLSGILMLTVPQVMEFFLPFPEGVAMNRAATQMQRNWHGQLFFYVSPLVFWNMALCVIGVADLFRLPRWKATIVVLLPAVGHLLFMIAVYAASVWMLKGIGTMPGASPPGGP